MHDASLNKYKVETVYKALATLLMPPVPRIGGELGAADSSDPARVIVRPIPL